jgi:hypothetical protein
MSSTSGKNIQIDLSQTYKNFDISKLHTKKLITLGELIKKLEEYKCFVPHGGCAGVHLGGHVQTGGKLFIRMFGILGDHIRAFTIITADMKKRYITKKTNPDLFYAVLGVVLVIMV